MPYSQKKIIWNNIDLLFEDNKGVIRIRKIEEGQTTQWPKEKGQKDKQQSAKHTHRIKDWVTPTPLKTGGEFR
jgi:hypothetical protein